MREPVRARQIGWIKAALPVPVVPPGTADVHLLPALPAAWATGAVRGLVARGSFVVDMSWQNGRLTTARLTSRAGAPCVLRTSGPVRVRNVLATSTTATAAGTTYYLTSFPTKAGASYEVVGK